MKRILMAGLIALTMSMIMMAQHPLKNESEVDVANIPVYLVDGVEVNSLADIDPNDIEEIKVIKDSTICNLFAPRTGGVIQITTKSKTYLKKAISDYQAEHLKFRQKTDEVRIR